VGTVVLPVAGTEGRITAQRGVREGEACGAAVCCSAMRYVLAITVVALAPACAPAALPAPVAPPSPAVVAAPVAPPAAPPSTQSVVQNSHEVLAAMDRGDVPAVAAALAPDYFHFARDYTDRDHELHEVEAVRTRGPKAPHIGTRTWSHERVSVRANDAIFVGEALEHVTGNESHGGYDFDGWYTLAWSRDGDDWKLVYLGWRQGGSGGERAVWDEIYRNSIGFNHEPNRLLIDSVARARPGTALDVAMGQGRNALYLASKGWRVTGVDISDEGIAAARASAAQRKLALDAIDVDIDKYDFGTNKWDLVTMIYATDNAAWMEKIKRSLRKGGLFVFEYFAQDLSTGDDGGVPPGKLAKIFADGFDIVRDEVVDDVPDWAVDRAKLVRFVARKR
jgi:SAM-dependent methyltransferase